MPSSGFFKVVDGGFSKLPLEAVALLLDFIFSMLRSDEFCCTFARPLVQSILVISCGGNPLNPRTLLKLPNEGFFSLQPARICCQLQRLGDTLRSVDILNAADPNSGWSKPAHMSSQFRVVLFLESRQQSCVVLREELITICEPEFSFELLFILHGISRLQ